MWLDKPEDEKRLDDSFQTQSVGAGGGAELQPSKSETTSNPSTFSPTEPTPTQNFGTIQDYFKGNQAQGEQLGEKLTGKLATSQEQEKNAISQAASQAASDIGANTIGFNQGLVSEAAKDPTKIAGNEDQFNDFLKQWNASYKGPESFESTTQYDTAAKAAEEAKQKAAQAESTGGRQQLIQDEFGVYGQGNKGLDEALLQQSSYFPKIGEQATNFKSLQDYLASKSTDLKTQAQAAKQATEQAKQKTQEAFLGDTGVINQFKTDIDTRTTKARADADKISKDLETAIANNANLTDEQLGLLGVTRQQYTDLIRQQRWAGNEPNLKDYFTAYNPSATISRENVATSEDVAKDAAIAKLTGGSNLLGQQSQSGKLVDFDNDKALQDYLNQTNADQATRDAARRKYEDARAAEEVRINAENTAAREGTQNSIAGGIAGLAAGPQGGAFGAAAPGFGKAIGDIISKDATASKITSAIGSGSQKIIDAAKKLFGGGKKDAVVNLPTLTIPDIEIPMAADLKTTQAIKNVFTKPLNTDGSYHEGAVYDMVDRLAVLKQAYNTNQISDKEYNTYAQPLAQWAQNAFYSIMGASSAAANSAAPAYNKFLAGNYLKPVSGSSSQLPADPNRKPIKAFSKGGVVESSLHQYLNRTKR